MISILGCGWYGMAAGHALAASGFKVNGSATSKERFSQIQLAGIMPYLAKLDAANLYAEDGFFNCETLIVSIPPKLRSGKGDDYLIKIQLLIPTIVKHNIKQVIYISSTGVYPDGSTTVDELTLIEADTPSGKVLREAEDMFMKQPGFKTTIIRFGGLVGPGRHPGRFFASKQHIPNGQAPVNLIHLQDCVGITLSILQQKAFGYIFNACSPHHPPKQDFYREAALHAGLPLPQFINELREWKIVNCLHLPTVLHYNFVVNNWWHCFNNNLF